MKPCHLARRITSSFLALVFLFAAMTGASSQNPVESDRLLEDVQNAISRLLEEDGEAFGPPMELISRRDYQDAWRRMTEGRSQLVGEVELPSADAEAFETDCTTCKLVLQSIVVFRRYLDEMEAERAKLQKASTPDIAAQAEVNVGIMELQKHLRLLSISAADCFDRCVPPGKISRLFIPTPFEVPVRAYPGEPVTCRACQTILIELRKVNGELFAARRDLDRLEALDRYYRSRFGKFDISTEGVPPEGLEKMLQLAEARYRLVIGPQRIVGPLLPSTGRPSLLNDLESTPTFGGRCLVMLRWAYKELTLRDDEREMLSKDIDQATTKFWTWLYGAPYQTTEEVQSFVNKGLGKEDLLRLERLVLQATIHLAKRLPPARKKVAELGKQRREILARLFDCHSRQCIPRAGDPAATSPLPIEPPTKRIEPDEAENTARAYVDLPPLEPKTVPIPGEKIEADEANKGVDTSPLPEDDPVDGGRPVELAPATPVKPDKAELQPPPEVGLRTQPDGSVLLGGGVQIGPDGAITGADGTPLTPQQLAGALVEGAGTAPEDDEDPEMASLSEGSGLESALAEQAAIREELEKADTSPEQVAVRTVQPLPSVPAAARQCSDAAPESIAACSRLPDTARSRCEQLVGRRDCLTGISRDGQGIQSCLLSCEATAAQQELNEFILATGLQTAAASYQTMLVSREATLREASVLLGRIAELEAEIEDMERGRRVFYYENTNTGVIIDHFGERFEPVPPLVYRGEGRLPLIGKELEKLGEARAERETLRQKRDALLEQAETSGDNDDLGQWYLNATTRVWKPAPTGALWCTPEMFANRYDACRRECSERGFRNAECLGQYSDNRTELDTYYLTQGLYPPGHPDRPE